MAINFPSPAINGQTYKYNEVTYIYSKNGTDEGYWKVSLPTVSGVATPEEIDEGSNNVKYASPQGLAGSKYVREDEASGETVLSADGLERVKAHAQGVDITGKMLVDGARFYSRYYKSDLGNAPNNFISGNIGSDANVAPERLEIAMSVEGNTILISGQINIVGFDVPGNDDSGVGITVEKLALQECLDACGISGWGGRAWGTANIRSYASVSGENSYGSDTTTMSALVVANSDETLSIQTSQLDCRNTNNAFVNAVAVSINFHAVAHSPSYV